MFHPETCTRRDIITILFVDVKTSLHRDNASESMATVISRMGPEPTFAELEESCALDADRRTRTKMVAENEGDFVDDLEPYGLHTAPPTSPAKHASDACSTFVLISVRQESLVFSTSTMPTTAS